MAIQLEIPGQLIQKTNKSLPYFWAGFIIYTVTYALAFPSVNYLKVYVFMQLLGLTLLVAASFGVLRLDVRNIYLRLLYISLCVWFLYTIKRGLPTNTTGIINMIVDANSGVLLYFAPLALLLPREVPFYKKLFDVIAILGVFYLLLDAYYIRDLLNPDHSSGKSQAAVESLSQYLSFPAGFLLFTLNYHTKKRRFFALAIMILSILFAVIRARRGLISMFGVSAIFAFILYLLTTKRKFIIVPLMAVLVFLLVGFVQQAFSEKSKLFGFLAERGTEDTRTPVEECFYDDMGRKDWIVGRGMNGEYFCPIVEEDADIKGYRAAIETGYLQIILDGGIVSLALILLIAVPAMICGIFFSKNVLSKAAGFWILLWVLSLYPANVATFSLNYFLVWISIGICYSKTIRKMPEEIVRKAFNLKNGSDLSYVPS